MRQLFQGFHLSLFILLSLLATPVHAGGSLEVFNFTNPQPSPIPGQLLIDLAPMRRDARCIPTPYAVNIGTDPIPNPLGGAAVSIADAAAVLQQGFDAWNGIPTSFIDLRITSTVNRTTAPVYDTVNELSFIAPAGFGLSGLVAFSNSPSMMFDSFVPDGMDFDGDGDSDVSNAITQCADVDSDGDVEIPEGTYPAGTILDNDIYFDASVYRFTLADSDLDANPFSIDLLGIATHEAGHAHGLAHVLENQLSDGDGTGSTMFPLVDSTDPADQIGQRSLASDDRAHSSLFYPEGSAATGPAAIQPGDVPFDDAYGLLAGSVLDGATGDPVAGASVSAIDVDTGRVAAAAYSGAGRFSFNPATSELSLIDATTNVLHGAYEIPVAAGTYALLLEAPDGLPVSADRINFTTLVGAALGQLTFREELYNGHRESAIEEDPGEATLVTGTPGYQLGGLDFVTNVQQEVAGFGPLASIGLIGAPAGLYYAVRVPGSEILAADQGNGLYLQSVEFLTFLFQRSEIPRFEEAILTTGSVAGTEATVNLKKPLARAQGFVGQDADFAPFYFSRPAKLSKKVLKEIRKGKIEDLFLVLQVPAALPTPTASGLAPVVGLALPATRGMSYVSSDGRNWTLQPGFDFMFRLVLTTL